MRVRIYVYMYTYICACVCVCVYKQIERYTAQLRGALGTKAPAPLHALPPPRAARQWPSPEKAPHKRKAGAPSWTLLTAGTSKGSDRAPLKDLRAPLTGLGFLLGLI